VFEKAYNENFVVTLTRKLYAIDVEHIVRRAMYRQAADEWPIGHTPPEVKEQYEAEMKEREEQEEITSDDNANSDHDGRVSSVKGVLASNLPRRSSQIHELPTSLISADSPLSITAEKCRRRVSDGRDNEQRKHRTKTHATFSKTVNPTENSLPNESRGRIRKRRRNQDVEDAEEVVEERPTKTRVTDTRPIRQLRTRRPGRLKTG
jgi:hypothetical protein